MANEFPGLMRSHFCGEMNSAMVNQKVVVCGWVTTRDLGGLHFVDLRDKRVVQLSFEKWLESGGDINILRTFSRDCYSGRGEVQLRPEAAINIEMVTGMK